MVWKAIAENDLKNNTDYSAYVFRNKKQEDSFNETKIVPHAIPNIYNNNAVTFIANILRGEQ